MNRRITWASKELHDIERVYQKAEKTPDVAALLELLEQQALTEAQHNCAMLQLGNGASLSPELFGQLTPTDIETLIKTLGVSAGLHKCVDDAKNSVIDAVLAPLFSRVQACTVFVLLDRLATIEWMILTALSVRDHQEHTVVDERFNLNLRIPTGGEAGMAQWETLISLLFPWITVHEVPSDETAEDRYGAVPQGVITMRQSAIDRRTKFSSVSASEATKKKSVWSRLFRK